jgi:hypothetical protein
MAHRNVSYFLPAYLLWQMGTGYDEGERKAENEIRFIHV